MTLLEDLKQAGTPAPPRDFAPGVVYAGGKPSTITLPASDKVLEGHDDWAEAVEAMGVTLPAGHRLELVEARYNQNAWTRQAQGEDAVTRPSWLYKFKVVIDLGLRDDEDLALLAKEARKRAKVKPAKHISPNTSLVINLADFQVGKVDELGGTAELLERSEEALARILTHIRGVRPSELVLIDVGDSTEGFESAPNAARTNDLQMTEQIRVWRRIFFRWIDALARLGIPLKVISVPSNHCRVRSGKDALGPANDDWGLEVLAMVADMASTNPGAYEHVEFIVPRTHDEHVTVTLHGGKILTAAHGHQARQPNALVDWAKGKSPREVRLSDVVVVGHFHHFRAVTFGEDQMLFSCPTMDPGSSWFTPSSGERSRPGVLTFVVDESGWRDIFVAWA